MLDAFLVQIDKEMELAGGKIEEFMRRKSQKDLRLRPAPVPNLLVG